MTTKINLLAPPGVPKPVDYRRLLECDADSKTRKGTVRGYLTGICYLAPNTESGVMNTCTSASAECAKLCLYGSGMARVFPKIKAARIAKTVFLHENRAAFVDSLRYDIRALEYTAARHNLTPCVRINGTSDLPWLALQMAAEFPSIQFYDYTKHARAHERQRSNYHLTFSHSGTNADECMRALAHGVNVAVVFDCKPAIKGRREGEPLPATWHGYPVFDGDNSDLRFLDPRGHVIGLRAKDVQQDYVSKPKGTFFVSVDSLIAGTPGRCASCMKDGVCACATARARKATLPQIGAS